MQVLDVTDGSAPVFVGAIPQGGRTALDVASSNDRVFIGSTTGPPNAMNTYVQIFAGPCAPATAVAVIASAGSHLVGSPNPFRQTTRFSFGVDREGRYDVSIFDVAGRRVRRIDTGLLPRGIHQLEWDGLGSSGRPVPAGVYFVRLDGSGNSEATRIVRLR